MSKLVMFIQMGGYGFYVWSAYTSVIVFLTLQWFFSWKKWRKFLLSKETDHE